MQLILNHDLNIDEVLTLAKPKGVIYCGAYHGDNWTIFASHGCNNRVWIEPNPEMFRILEVNVPRSDPKFKIAICDKDEWLPFIITSSPASSSLYNLKVHSEKYPHIVPIQRIQVQGRKLDTLCNDQWIDIHKYDMLFMDLQGGEGNAIKGFLKNIKHINHIIAEVNYQELYTGCMLIEEFDALLLTLGFVKEIECKYEKFSWGDVYYKRKS